MHNTSFLYSNRSEWNTLVLTETERGLESVCLSVCVSVCVCVCVCQTSVGYTMKPMKGNNTYMVFAYVLTM